MKIGRPRTVDQDKVIKLLRADPMLSCKEIADLLGCSRPSVGNIARKNKLQRKQGCYLGVPHKKWSKIMLSEVLEKRSEGWSMQKIGDKFGVSRQRIYQILQTSEQTPEETGDE